MINVKFVLLSDEKKTAMLRNIGKQSRECADSVPKKKRTGTVGGFAEKEGFNTWNDRVRVDGRLIIISLNVSSITTV